MQTIFQDEFHQVQLDEARGLARMARSSVAYPDLAAAEAALTRAMAALRQVARPSRVVLVDVRQGPMRNDPAFEQLAARFRAQYAQGFGRAAVLVRTAVGKLQISRYGREANLAIPIFQDEREALEFLKV